MSTRVPPSIAAVVALMLLAMSARAAATFRLRADASATASDSRTATDAPPTHDGGVLTIGLLPASGVIGQSADALAQFCEGSSSSAAEFILPFPGGFEGAVVRAQAAMAARTPGNSQPSQSAAGSSRAEALYDDVLTASGPPAGSPVSLRVRLDLDRNVARFGVGATCSALLSFGDPGDSLGARALTDGGPDGNLVLADSFVVNVVSGTPRPFELRLLVQSAGSASTPGNFMGASEFNTVSADYRSFPHHGRLYIDVLTPGATYALASGADLRSTAVVTAAPSPSDGVLRLRGASPNPARGVVTMSLVVPAGGARGAWAVYDAAGRAVWHSPKCAWPAGVQTLAWPGTDAAGHAAPPGVYLVRVVTDRGVAGRRVARVE